MVDSLLQSDSFQLDTTIPNNPLVHSVRYLAVESEAGSSIPHCASWEKNQPLGSLGKLHSPRTPPEQGNGKPLLSILYIKTLERVT